MKKMISSKEAKERLTKKPVKKKRKTEIKETFKIQRRAQEGGEVTKISAGKWRPIMEETIARVTGEIFPGMKTHTGNAVEIELKEFAYVLGLTMVAGNEKDLPRIPLKIKQADISDTAKLCRECR